MYDMKLLETYQCTDEHGRDQGAIVRQKVKDLLDFIEDDERVRSERKHAKKVKEKMSGISGEASYSSSRRHYSDQYDGEQDDNEDPVWRRRGRGDDVYVEDNPRRSQRQSSEYKDDDEADDEDARDSRGGTKTREMTVHSDQRTTKQKTTQNDKNPPKLQNTFGDFQTHKSEEDEFDPRAGEKSFNPRVGEKGAGHDDGYGDFLDYRSKPTQDSSTAAGDLLGLELMTSAPVGSSTYPSTALPPAPLSPKSSGMMGIQPTTMGVQPSMMGAQPNMMGVQPNMMGVQPNMMGVQPNMMGVQPNMMGVQPNMMGAQPRMMGVQSNMASVQSGMMGIRPTMMGVQQQNMMGFYQPNIMGGQPPGVMGLYSATGGMHQPVMASGYSAQGNASFHQQSGSLL